VARHDIQCASCELIIRDIQIPGDKIKDGKVRKQCPDCKNRTFLIYWGSGESPGVATIGNDKEKIFDSCKTVGEYLDNVGVDFGSKEYHKASKARVERMRQKAVKNAKRKKADE